MTSSLLVKRDQVFSSLLGTACHIYSTHPHTNKCVIGILYTWIESVKFDDFRIHHSGISNGGLF